MIPKIALSILLLLLLPCVACYRIEQPKGPIAPQEYERLVVISIDMSGSFKGRWKNSQRETFERLVEDLFRASMGSNDTKMIISQLSGEEESLLWEGTPSQLKGQFQTRDALYAYLVSRSDPTASKIYLGICNALRYVNGKNGVTDDTEVLLAVFSDCIDSEQDQAKRYEEGNKLLKALGEFQGTIALFGVEQTEVERWRVIFNHEKVKLPSERWAIASKIDKNPPLPEFD